MNLYQIYNGLSPSGKEQLHIALFVLIVGGIGTLIYHNYSSWIKLSWKFSRKIFFKTFPQQQVVTFCVKHHEVNSGIYYEAIKNKFLFNLEQYKLGDVISYKDHSDIYLFKNSKEAEKFRNKKDLSLILWGEFTNDKLKKNGGLESEFLLFFTYEFNYSKTKNNRENIRKEFDRRIGQFLALKNKWSIRENESLQDVANVADGMFTVAIFTVALTLLNRGDVEKSTFVFNQLHKYLNQRTDIAAGLLKPYVRQCSAILVNKAYKEKEPDWKSIASLCQKIVDIQQDLDSLVLLAYSQYKSGNKEASRNIVGRLMNSYPKSMAAKVNLAFFRMLDGKYKDALKIYLQIFKVRNPDFSTVEIIDFLSTEYENTGEIGFLFVSGGISYYHNQDYVLAKHDIKKFLSKASKEKYGDMYLEAQQIMFLINGQKKKRGF